MATAKTDTTERPDLDLTAGLAEISNDLFAGGEGDEGEDEEGSAQDDAEVGEELPNTDAGVVAGEDQVEAPPQDSPPADQNTAAVEETGAPKTWTKEAIAEWATIPPRAQAEILKREQDFFKGIEQYKTRAAEGEAYAAVVAPYAPILASENINPVELFKNFANNHYLLSRGTPEQKVALAAELLKAYNISPEEVGARLGPAPYVDPDIAALRQQVAEANARAQRLEQQTLEGRRAEVQATVEAFFNDPKNIYAKELVDDINHLIKTGAETTLEGAYQTAMYRNPAVREKEVARLQAAAIASAQQEAARKAADVKAALGVNVKTSGKTVNGTVPVGTMDETLEETMAAISRRGA